MKFLADEGIDRSIVDGLRVIGFDVYYVIEEVRGLDDETILQIAIDEKRILITKDKDFGELVFRLNKGHAGVVLLRLEGMSTRERADMVGSLILKYKMQLQNSFTVIQKKVIRIRPAQ